MIYKNQGPDFVMPEGLYAGKKYKHGENYDITEIPPMYVNRWFFADAGVDTAEETPAETYEKPKVPVWDEEDDE